MISILEIEKGIWTLQENGKSVLLLDCLQFGISKQVRKSLMNVLTVVTSRLIRGESLESLVENGLLKKLIRQKEVVGENFWELRNEGQGERIIFTMREPHSIIVAAANKAKGPLNQSINRGVKRWKKFLRENEKSQWPTL